MEMVKPHSTAVMWFDDRHPYLRTKCVQWFPDVEDDHGTGDPNLGSVHYKSRFTRNHVWDADRVVATARTQDFAEGFAFGMRCVYREVSGYGG